MENLPSSQKVKNLLEVKNLVLCIKVVPWKPLHPYLLLSQEVKAVPELFCFLWSRQLPGPKLSVLLNQVSRKRTFST